jgi:hypothetical protein
MKIAILCQNDDLKFVVEYLNSMKEYLNYDLVLFKKKKIKKIKNLSEKYDVIFFIKEFIDIFDLKDKKKIFLINMEQMTREFWRNKVLEMDNLIDYSMGNISLLKRENIIYFPYGVNKNEIYDIKKEFDICMITNSQSNKRNNIFNEIKNRGGNIDLISLFGEERDKIVFKYKILINIHFDDDFQVYESLRCDRCIFNKMIVITEKSLDDNTILLKDKLVICNYEDIVDKALEIINNYDFYYNKTFDNFDNFVDLYDKKVKNIYEENLLKFQKKLT